MTTRRATWTDWAEDHWAGVAMTLSVGGALMTSIVLILAFNVIATSLGSARHDVLEARGRLTLSSESGLPAAGRSRRDAGGGDKFKAPALEVAAQIR